MIIGQRIPDTPLPLRPLILLSGQSNTVGRAQYQRIANTQYNYFGISTGYPAIRNGQDQYQATPADVYCYNRTTAANSDWGLDNSTWQAYNAATNANFEGGTFGCELSLATRIALYTGKETFINKSAWGGTALSPTITTNKPGAWLNSNSHIAERLMKWAARDFNAFRDGNILSPVADVWWQGENDASGGLDKATYKANWLNMHARRLKCIQNTFLMIKPVVTFIVLLSYQKNSVEDVIREALTELASETPNCVLVTVDDLPRKEDLTPDEAVPLAIGTPNAAGDNDDHHSSYIRQFAVGETCYQHLLDNGYLEVFRQAS